MSELRRLLAGRLRKTPPEPDCAPERGDHDLNPHAQPGPARGLRPAGVLVPIIERAGGATVLFTVRAGHLPSHAGQISFPGGGMQAGDRDYVDAALRETHEEVGVAPERIEVAGYLGLYRTVTDYCVLPVVGFLPACAPLVPDPNEVTEAFEAPLDFLMNPENHRLHSRTWRGKERFFYAIPYKDYYIWGATAAMLVDLHERVFGHDSRSARSEEAAS
ncbi:MAG: NUDIX hydrolase [Alphaproteobacteria bacterium]